MLSFQKSSLFVLLILVLAKEIYQQNANINNINLDLLTTKFSSIFGKNINISFFQYYHFNIFCI